MLCRLLTNRVDIFPNSFLTNRVDIFQFFFDEPRGPIAPRAGI